MKPETKKWIDKARDDLQKAKDNFKIEHYDLASFLCQQAVEKSLKAILIERKSEFPKIHDLVRLGKLADIPNKLTKRLRELTLIYVYTRYPDIPEEKDLMSKSADFIKHSEEVLKWIEKSL